MYDERHGGPYDRGMADKYYGRPYCPHYYVGATYITDRVDLKDMTSEEVLAYTIGFEDCEETKETDK